ncbi:16S rRNA (guanine(527)-N(7))-methyltransferase RsmG [Kineococcus auxinigenes]|uniref:16S rRNA (guanine(527)-N(7))-methyltransferase RsmG n=1 Tax=Kineococcus sp. SYSU DK033 TaxID=3383154 RepID=UPI003D7DEB06
MGGWAGPAPPPPPPPPPPSVVPPTAADVFGDQLSAATAYYEFLATAGVERGLIGPREVPRLWDRHLLNCAYLGDLIEEGKTVVDVGSGAGLPGIALALARPDLQVQLIEPLERRYTFLREAISRTSLGDRVAVARGRAEDVAGEFSGDVVTARAVAPLATLYGWTLPLCRQGGYLLAIKGRSAAEEVAAASTVLAELGIDSTPEVVHCGPAGDEGTTVVRVARGGGPLRRRPVQSGPRPSPGNRRQRTSRTPGRKKA